MKNLSDKIFLFTIGVSMVLLLIVACKKEDTTVDETKLNGTDSLFIQKAAAYDSAEISAAALALTKVDSAYMIAYSESMLFDHSKARNDLKVMGNVVGFTVRDSISNQNKTLIAYLASITDSTFDSTYVTSRLVPKQMIVDMYIDEVDNGNQKNIRNYASFYLDIVRQQYSRADSIRFAYFP